MPPIRPDKKSERIRCLWPTCEKTFRYGRKQDRDRHVMSLHLPLFLLCRGCGRRDGREDEHKAHLKDCVPENKQEPCSLYDKNLVLGWLVEDRAPAETVKRYALDFVREWGRQQGNQAVLDDPCGRQATRSAGQCQCNEDDDIITVPAVTEPIDNDISSLPSTSDIEAALEALIRSLSVPSGQPPTDMPLYPLQDSSSWTLYPNPSVGPSPTVFDDEAFNANFHL